jgi:glyoxylase-like metal-dependent hydrolase (beta-lactamase superfamily II)
MAFDTLQVGHIEVLALIDGDQDLGSPIAEAFPDIPLERLMAAGIDEPGICGAGDSHRLRVRAWLVRHPAGVLLVDTGIGQTGAPGVVWFDAPGRLLEVLRETGTPPDAIDTVLLTHVHDDHIGGTVVFDDDQVPAPAFPNARYVLQSADREWQRELARTDAEERAIETLLLQPLEDAGLLDVVEGDHQLADGLMAHLAPGHTPGHQVVRIHSRNRRALISGDAFNHPLQVGHPDWPAAGDDVPARAAMTRRSLLAELLSHPGTTLAPTHFTGSFGHIGSGADGLAAWVVG